ncbi:MAG: hypothetical protein M3Z06_14735 [Actinomycetota bacterium]|nr:hypothetical protein [Actinomycetota bacterium]
MADEIERRMPGGTQTSSASSASGSRLRGWRSRSTAASPASRSRRTGASRSPARAAGAKTAAASGAKTAAAPKANGARAPRGQNKAKILKSLKSGPKTASVIAKETGIGTGTVGSTLSKLATSGEVVKAARGYGLPS